MASRAEERFRSRRVNSTITFLCFFETFLKSFFSAQSEKMIALKISTSLAERRHLGGGASRGHRLGTPWPRRVRGRRLFRDAT